VQGAERQITSAEAKRVVDISLGAGWLHSFAAGRDEGLKAADFVAASVSVPLPFSLIYKGGLEAARKHIAKRKANCRPPELAPKANCAKPSPISKPLPGELRSTIKELCPIRCRCWRRSSTAMSTATPRWWRF